MLKKIVLSICLFLPFLTKGQDKLPILTSKNPEDISDYISENFKLATDTFCLETVIFIRFSVNKKGEIANLSFSKNAPKLITDELEKAMLSSNGRWKITNADWKVLERKVFLQPYVISFQAGCSVKGVDNDIKLHNESLRMGALRYERSRNTSMAIRELLKFTDKEFSTLDCTILPPLSISTME